MRFPHSVRSGRRLVVPTALALVAVGLFTAGAAAANPTATVSLSPGSRVAGSTATMTLTVVPDSGTLAQVDLTTPSAGWSVKTSASTTTNADGTTTVTVKNLKVGPSSTYSLSFEATAPCTLGDGLSNRWGLVLTQKAGGTYSYATPLGTAITSTVTEPTQCTSRFTGQPADTAAGDVIYGDAFAQQFPALFPNPAAVTVTVFRGNETVDLAYGSVVSLFLASDPTGTNPLTGDVTSAASRGVAGVPDPFLASIPNAYPGLFRFGAIVPDVPSPSPSRAISIVKATATASCSHAGQGRTCSVDLQNDGVSTHAEATSTQPAVLVAGGSDITSTGATFSCPGQLVVTSSTVAFDYTGDGSVKVTETISKELMNSLAQNGMGKVDICIASITRFIEKDGTQADLNANLGLYVGLLPFCGPKITNKCIVDKRKNLAGQGIITYLLAPGDPPRRL